MKKWIIILLILVIIVGIGGFFILKNVEQSKKEYSVTKVENYNYFPVRQNEKYGVIDHQGKVIIEAKYDEIAIPNPEKDLFICYQNNQPIALNSNSEQILTDYEMVQPIRLKDVVSDLMYEKSVLTYMKNEKYGLIDVEGNKITENKYESIEALPSQEGKLLVKQNGKIGIININGYNIVECNYDQIKVDDYFEEGQLYKYAGYIVSNTTNEGYRYGYINYDGQKIIEPLCNELTRVTEIKDENNVYMILAVNGKYGVYKNKDEIISNDYQSIYYEQGNQVFVIEKTGKYGVANINGKIIIPVEHSQINITGNCIYAKDENETKVFDKEGKELPIDENTSVIDVENTNYAIKITNTEETTLYGIIDKTGKEIIPQKYKYIEYLYDNYFIASNKQGQLGIIDNNDKVKLELSYESLQKVSGTNIVQAVKEETTEFYSSKIEKICELTKAKTKTDEQYIYIYNEEERKYIDKQAEKEIKNTEVFKENTLFAIKENDLWGFADSNGNSKIAPEYEKVTEFNKYGYAGIKKDGKWGVINSNGEIVLNPVYEIDEESEENLSFIGKYYGIEYSSGEIYYTDEIIKKQNTNEKVEEE